MPKLIRTSLTLFLALATIGPAAVSVAAAGGRPTRPLPAPVSVADDGLSRALERNNITEATYVLERARSLFSRAEVRARYGSVAKPDPRSATTLLRDLALRTDQLKGDDLDDATSILARPTSPDDFETDYGADYKGIEDETICTLDICVHWVESGANAPDLTDADTDGVPDWIETVVETYTYVITTDADALGYQRVKSDEASEDNGGNGIADVYLADIGDNGIYGYCTTDDPNLQDIGDSYQGWDVSAYCVIDEDFHPSQFPVNTPTENLQVTAAHEYFHAIQFGYDVGEDGWFFESTAAWIEDVLYDDVNDNYQYLSQSAITYPDLPIDWDSNEFPLLVYGGWLYFRFITEYLAEGTTVANDAVRMMWERAAFRAAHPEDRDDYSIKAVKNELKGRGHDFTETFADFAAANWMPGTFYEEGAAYAQWLRDNDFDPDPWAAVSYRVKNGRKYAQSKKTHHLSTTNVVFRPRSSVGRSKKLQIRVSGPNAKSAPVARVIIFKSSGAPVVKAISLNSKGDGSKTIKRFGAASSVVLSLSNTSIRYHACFSGYAFSCGGLSRDDNKRFAWVGKIK